MEHPLFTGCKKRPSETFQTAFSRLSACGIGIGKRPIQTACPTFRRLQYTAALPPREKLTGQRPSESNRSISDNFAPSTRTPAENHPYAFRRPLRFTGCRLPERPNRTAFNRFDFPQAVLWDMALMECRQDGLFQFRHARTSGNPAANDGKPVFERLCWDFVDWQPISETAAPLPSFPRKRKPMCGIRYLDKQALTIPKPDSLQRGNNGKSSINAISKHSRQTIRPSEKFFQTA